MKKLLYSAAAFWILLASCHQEEKEKIPLAQVGDNILYKEDVEKVIPNNLSGTDSALWADDFVKKWVRSELVVLNAEQNLSPEQKNVNKELNEYRNSLLTYRYKNELMVQKMDTIITSGEISTYYQQHKNEYILKNNIVKAIFIKIPFELANAENIKRLCKDNDPQKLAQLNEYCMQYAKTYDRFGDQWINSANVFNQLPEGIGDEDRFLKRNQFAESSDTDYYYFICIRDYRMAGETAPQEYVEPEIRNILLNDRKIKFLKDIEEDIYQEGVASNKFKIFNTKK